MPKHELNAFFDSLKSEGRLLSLSYVYEQLEVRPGLDLYYMRQKLEDMFKEGLVTTPAPYLDLLRLTKLFEDLPEWSANGVHIILEKCLELSREEDLLKVLDKCIDRISTTKVVDLLKKVMILDRKDLSEKLLDHLLAHGNHGKSRPFSLGCLETYLMSKTSSIKNKEAIDTIVHVKGMISLSQTTAFFVKCLIQNSNYEEIISNVDYLHAMKLPLNEEPICQLLMCYIEHEDWPTFRRYFQVYFDSKCVSELTIKTVISALVEKSALDILRFIVTITMKDKTTFMNLKLTENQYKCIILSLVKSSMSMSTKTAGQSKPVDLPKDGIIDQTQINSPKSPQFEIIQSDDDISDDFIDIIDDHIIDDMIVDIVNNENIDVSD